jgi:hypothetical protein
MNTAKPEKESSHVLSVDKQTGEYHVVVADVNVT